MALQPQRAGAAGREHRGAGQPRRHGHEPAGALRRRRPAGAADRPVAAASTPRVRGAGSSAPACPKPRPPPAGARDRIDADLRQRHQPRSRRPRLAPAASRCCSSWAWACSCSAGTRSWSQLLVERGFRVIRFDNRDIGLSQSFDAAGVPNLALDSLRHASGLRVKSPYTLADMADDAVGVLDALGIAQAHVCGASMGGMIAQQLAARAPERVKSLTLMMTSSGARRLPGPTLKVRSAMISRPPDPNAVRQHRRALRRALCADRQPGVSVVAATTCAIASRPRCSARTGRPGTARQMVAIARRRRPLAAAGAIRAPTQIIHGAGRPAGAGGRRPATCTAKIARRADRLDRRHGPRPAGAALAALRRRHRQRGRSRLSRARASAVRASTPRLTGALARSAFARP